MSKQPRHVSTYRGARRNAAKKARADAKANARRARRMQYQAAKVPA